MNWLASLGVGLGIGYAAIVYGKSLAGTLSVPNVFGMALMFVVFLGGLMVVAGR